MVDLKWERDTVGFANCGLWFYHYWMHYVFCYLQGALCGCTFCCFYSRRVVASCLLHHVSIAINRLFLDAANYKDRTRLDISIAIL